LNFALYELWQSVHDFLPDVTSCDFSTAAAPSFEIFAQLGYPGGAYLADCRSAAASLVASFEAIAGCITVDIHACSGHFGCPFSPHAAAAALALGVALPALVAVAVAFAGGAVSVGPALAVVEAVALAEADAAMLADVEGSASLAEALADAEADGSAALSLAALSAVGSDFFSPLRQPVVAIAANVESARVASTRQGGETRRRRSKGSSGRSSDVTDDASNFFGVAAGRRGRPGRRERRRAP
jgi:hypothetical protein